MSSGLDMSLDDIIKSNKRSAASSGEFRGRGRGSAAGTGPTRRIPNRAVNRAAPYSLSKVQAPDSTWQHDMFMDQVAAFAPPAAMARPSAIETGTKLYISNLEYGVSNEDIKELFSEVGDLKRHSIHYDRSGRSKGTAEVVFSRRADALAAVKRYNNVQLDGKPMKIEIVGTNISTLPAPVVPFVPNVGFGNTNFFPRSGAARGGPPGWSRGGLRGRGGGGGRGGRGRGRGGGRGDPISPADLDADLDKYYKEYATQQKNNN